MHYAIMWARLVKGEASHKPTSIHRQASSPSEDAQENPVTVLRRNRVFWNVTAFIAFIVLMMSSLNAQETRATLSGTITDPSKAAIVGATLRLTNLATTVTSTVNSNSDGQFRFLFIDPGNYKLTAEANGFESYVENGIVLNVESGLHDRHSDETGIAVRYDH